MSHLHLVGVLVRLFAIYLIVSTLERAPEMIATAITWGVDRWVILGTTFTLAVPILTGIALWAFNLSVAKRLFFGRAGDKELELAGAEHLELAAFSLAGLWLVCSGLVNAVYWFGFVIFSSAPQWPESVLTPDQKGSMLSCAFGIAMGVFLLLRAKGLLKLISLARG